MLSSTYNHMNTVTRFFCRTRPTATLDVGAGNGKIGVVAREALDVTVGECYRRNKWALKIGGVEASADYMHKH